MLGPGFTFEEVPDDDTNSIAEMNEIISSQPQSSEVIYPLIGGKELLNTSTLVPTRFAIDFFDRPLEQAREYAALIAIVMRKVKPQRDRQKRNAYRERWWQYAERQARLYNGLKPLQRCIVAPQTCTHLVFAFMPAKIRFSQSLNVILFEDDSAFGILQSRVHEIWTRFFASSLEDRLRYTPTDCFDTFPFPPEYEANGTLAAQSRHYYEYRSQVMVSNNEGLTDTYNRFHDPYEKSPEIVKLRELHAAVDDAVLRAYGWDDLADRAAQPGGCEFLLDYEEELGDGDSGLGTGEGKKSKKKKPWRYRWPDDFRDEVLARLLELNAERHREEMLAGPPSKGDNTKAKAQRGRKKKTVERELFELD